MLELKVEKREELGKASKELGKAGKMPAVFYGPKEETTPITVPAKSFLNVWKEAGESTVVQLSGLGDPKDVLIHDVDVDPVSGDPRHVDFYVMEKGKKVTVSIPLEFEGEAPAVKELGGMIVKVLHELEIEALPKDLPHEIKIDVSVLENFDSQIQVKDLVLPEGVEATAEPEEVVVLAAEAKEEEEEIPAEVDLESIEVEQKGKKEEGDEGEAPAEGAEKSEV